MKDVQTPGHCSLNTLIGRLRDGRFVIPDFQRDFEWNPWDIRELMRSIFLDYYIGSLLLWKGTESNFNSLSCQPIYGYNGNGRPDYIVLDGQQRLTAMFYAFLSPDEKLPNRANRAFYYIQVDKFMAQDYDTAFDYEWFNKRWTKFLEDKESQFAKHLFPLSIVGAEGWELFEWVTGYEAYWKNQAELANEHGAQADAEVTIQHAINAKAFGEHLKGITGQYQISYVELDKDIAIEKVCDIFTQINSRGVRLDVFDLMNALLKPKEIQLKEEWKKVAPRLEFVSTPKMNVYILQVISILRQAYCSPKYIYFLLPGQSKPIRNPDGSLSKEVLIPNADDFKRRWHEAVAALEDAIDLLRHPQEFGAISSNYLPYVSILPVFAAIQVYVKTIPANKQLTAQRKARRWYWASVFTNRYSGSVESTSARDFLDMKAWIENDELEPALIQEFKVRFRNLELKKETRSGTSIYNGIFNLFILQGARDWMTGNVPQHDELDDHHIIPASWGKEHLEGNPIHTILNRTPLTATTNRKVISNRLPNAYLPELIAANGEATVRAILETHFISPAAQEILMRDPFTRDDFDLFINERQQTIKDAIEHLLIKERLDLPPRLRDLDESIELVELELRSVVTHILGNDPQQIPTHIMQRVEERIRRALNKNAALDTSNYEDLTGKLEYFDLREVEQTIVNKGLWPLFESRFNNKETLAIKFDQLAELRNSIRHSRQLSEITRKEGEAAILWFEQVLQK